MSSELPKYIKVKSLKEVNENAELYSLREPIVYQYSIDGGNGAFSTDVEYLMSLREENKYDNIDKYRSFPITSEEQTMPDGWQVLHHTSKELIGVTKKQQPKLSVIREALIQIFNIAEDNDTLDPTIMDQVYKLSEEALNELDDPVASKRE